jgi:hypothetical protein
MELKPYSTTSNNDSFFVLEHIQETKDVKKNL